MLNQTRGVPKVASVLVAIVKHPRVRSWVSRRIPLQEHLTIERVWGSSTPCRGKDKMRTYLAIAAAAVMITGAAMAQPANRDANTPAVNTPNTPPNPGAPVAGSNSFTEGQAKSRIESNGFSNVS